MEAFPAEQEAVLLLLERVGDAQRIATMQARAWGQGRGAGTGDKRRERLPAVAACTCLPS
jgi:hypothetical protein